MKVSYIVFTIINFAAVIVFSIINFVTAFICEKFYIWRIFSDSSFFAVQTVLTAIYILYAVKIKNKENISSFEILYTLFGGHIMAVLPLAGLLLMPIGAYLIFEIFLLIGLPLAVCGIVLAVMTFFREKWKMFRKPELTGIVFFIINVVFTVIIIFIFAKYNFRKSIFLCICSILIMAVIYAVSAVIIRAIRGITFSEMLKIQSGGNITIFCGTVILALISISYYHMFFTYFLSMLFIFAIFLGLVPAMLLGGGIAQKFILNSEKGEDES